MDWRSRLKFLSLVLSAVVVAVSAEAADEEKTIKMRIVVTNPSPDDEKAIPIRVEIPPPLADKGDVLRVPSELELKYDSETSTFYVEAREVEMVINGEKQKRKAIKLKPKDVKTFVVELNDVWYIPDGEMKTLRDRAEMAMARLEGSEYESKGEGLTEEIHKRLNNIDKFQTDDTISKEEYIVGYRYNKDRLKQIRGDIETLESYVDAAGARPTPDNPEEQLVDPLSRTATWLVIFIILTFLGILSGAFYFVWHKRARSDQSLAEAQGSAFDESEKGGEG